MAMVVLTLPNLQVDTSTNKLHNRKHIGRISDALIEGFLDFDERMLEDDGLKDVSGTNAGDSRAVVSVSANEEESKRIFAAGGWVEFNRVNGNLALSRALGDFAFKANKNLSAREQIVTACPEVETCTITVEHEFIILACDGIWDVMTSQEVIDFCRTRLASGSSPDLVCFIFLLEGSFYNL
ncbi:unnamed protein product [Meloidogyne enterolobii]|uniref:Uncharacterized protein n=4 Tax=Meloidogyne enterolobii TaxID=390850 RepID=A0ACB1BAA7_MELEN